MGKSTLTDRFQTTIPAFVRNELGLEKRDLIEFLKADDGYIVLRKAKPETADSEFSPELLAWLDFIARDHDRHPEQLKPFTREIKDRAYAIAPDLEVDLDKPLSDHGKNF